MLEDDARIAIPCPDCDHETEKTVKWLRRVTRLCRVEFAGRQSSYKGTSSYRLLSSKNAEATAADVANLVPNIEYMRGRNRTGGLWGWPLWERLGLVRDVMPTTK